MEIPTTHEILLFRLILCAIVLFFGATYAITLFIDSFFVCQIYAVNPLESCIFETGKESSWGYCTADCHFFTAEFILCFIVCLSFLWCSCLEAPLCNTIGTTVKHVFKRKLTRLTQFFNYVLPILFYHVPSIFIESDSICFGAPTLLSPTFVDYGKYVLSCNLHAMVGICKEGWLWDFLIKFYFG